MKNLFLLNRSGMSPDVTSRKGRHSLDSILSRFCLVSLICLCMLTIGSGNVWGANVTLTLSDNSTDTWTNQGKSGGGQAIAMYDKTVTGITLSGTSGYCNTSNSYTQIYASSVTTIASTVGNITKIIFNGKYNKTSGKFTDANSTYQAFTSTFSNKTFTYASGVSSMAFTADKQILLKSATVYYAVATTSTTSITGLDYTEGSGPSTAQSFTVSGTDLGGTLTVSAPTNFEVSKTSSTSGFASSVTLTPSSGTVSSTTIYVRLASGKSAGTYGGASTYVTVTGGGIITKNVSVSGTVSGGAITCDDPTGTSLGTTTHALTGLGSQVLNWTGAASNYEIYYNGSGNAPGDESSATINGAKTLTLTNLAPGTWYWWVRAKCSESLKSDWVSGGNFTINGIKLTNIEMTPTPHIDFGTVIQGASVTAVNIKVTGVGLSSSSTITHSFDVATPFTATPASLNYNANKANLTVTPSTATAGEFSRTLTITNGTYSQTVTVTMNVVAADRFIDVLQGTSGYEEATPHTETGTYSTPTLPDKSPATSGTCEEQHWHFMGWITADKYAAGTTIADGDLQTPTTASNTTYYAVWAKGSGTETEHTLILSKDKFYAAGETSSGYKDTDVTIDGITLKRSQWGWQQNGVNFYLQGKTNNAIYNNTQLGYIKSIAVTKYGGTGNIYVGTSKQPTTNETAISTTTLTYTKSNNYTYFKINSTSTLQLTSVVITYATGSYTYSDYKANCCIEPTLTFAASPYAVIRQDIQGASTTTWAEVDVTFTSNNTTGTISATTYTSGKTVYSLSTWQSRETTGGSLCATDHAYFEVLTQPSGETPGTGKLHVKTTSGQTGQGTYRISLTQASTDESHGNFCETTVYGFVDVTLRDKFVDKLNDNGTVNKDGHGAQLATPLLSELGTQVENACHSEGRKLKGWIKETDLKAQYETGNSTRVYTLDGLCETCTDGSDQTSLIVAPGTNVTMSGATWYAVWAYER